MSQKKSPPLAEGKSPPLEGRQILVAVENWERLERILAGHRLTIPHSVEEAKQGWRVATTRWWCSA